MRHLFNIFSCNRETIDVNIVSTEDHNYLMNTWGFEVYNNIMKNYKNGKAKLPVNDLLTRSRMALDALNLKHNPPNYPNYGGSA